MKRLAEYSSSTPEQEIIRILQGIVLPAVHYLNSMPHEKRLYYAPWLIGGTDPMIKLSILAYKKLYTPAVIRRLIESGTTLCEVYLTESQKESLCQKFNIKEFKKQVIQKNDDELLRLLLKYCALSPQEETELLAVRCNKCSSKDTDNLMKDYFSEKDLSASAKKLLTLPKSVHYWDLYRQSRLLSRIERTKHFLLSSWNKFRYGLGFK